MSLPLLLSDVGSGLPPPLSPLMETQENHFSAAEIITGNLDRRNSPLNMLPLNCFVQKLYFKMEGLGMIKDLMQALDVQEDVVSGAQVVFTVHMGQVHLLFSLVLQCSPHFYKSPLTNHGKYNHQRG